MSRTQSAAPRRATATARPGAPAPWAWREALVAAAVYAVVTLVFAYPAFRGGFLVSRHSDQYIGGYAVRTFGAAVWMVTGRLPQWNPYLFGGMPYMMGGPIASYVSPGHDGKLYVSALFPLMGWALVRGIRDGRVWAWPALALIVGFGILTPHPQLMQYALLEP